MALTPETLTGHELTGLRTEVVDAPNPDLVGIAGRVVRETMRTLSIRSADGDRQVPKAGTTFRFALPADGSVVRSGEGPQNRGENRGDGPRDTDEAAGRRKGPGSASELPSETAGAAEVAGGSRGGEDAVYVTVDGTRLLSRPALRTENAGDNRWR